MIKILFARKRDALREYIFYHIFKSVIILRIMKIDMKKLALILILLFVFTYGKKKTSTISDSQCIIDQALLFKHVSTLSKLEYSRSMRNKPYLDTAAFYIEDELTEMGYIHRRQEYKAKGKKVWNILTNIGKGPLIVLGAHYDVFWDTPGADDNASGVAGLLEIARILKKNESILKNRFEIAFYTLEEPPHYRTNEMGSYVHATSLFQKKEDVKLMICIEMIGYFSNEKIQEYPLGILKLFYPKTADYIAVVSNYRSRGFMKDASKAIKKGANIKVCHLAAPSWVPGIDFSDHQNFWAYKYRAIMISNTSFYRNSGYHTMHDTIEKLDFYKMGEVVIGVCKYLLQGI